MSWAEAAVSEWVPEPEGAGKGTVVAAGTGVTSLPGREGLWWVMETSSAQGGHPFPWGCSGTAISPAQSIDLLVASVTGSALQGQVPQPLETSTS